MRDEGKSRLRHLPLRWPGPFNRRQLLRIGSLGLSSSIWPGIVTTAANSDAHALAGSPRQARSVIFLWMAGGVTHLDSFDPKPEAPEEIRGTLTPIGTNLPGVRFA